MGKLFNLRFLLYHFVSRGSDFLYALRNAFGEREIALHRPDFDWNHQQVFRRSHQVKIILRGLAAKLGEEGLINPTDAFDADFG